MLNKSIALSSLFSNKALAVVSGTGATVVTLSAQLNEPHILFYLSVPFWIVIVAMLIVIVVSSILSAMTEKNKTVVGRLKKFFISLTLGLFVSFVFIPLFEDTPNPSRLILWAAVTSFVGNVALIYIVSILDDIKNNKDLKQSFSQAVIKNLKNRLKGAMMVLTGGDSDVNDK